MLSCWWIHQNHFYHDVNNTLEDLVVHHMMFPSHVSECRVEFNQWKTQKNDLNKWSLWYAHSGPAESKLHWLGLPILIPECNMDSLPWAPSVRGAPNSAGLAQIRSGSSFTVQSSFFKEFVLLYCWFQVSLLFCFAIYAADANFRLMHTLSYMTTAQPTSWGSLRHNFNLKLKTATWRYVCTLYIYEKEPHKPPEHTSEHVKSQNFPGHAPRPPSYNLVYGPHFLYLPWVSLILSVVLVTITHPWLKLIPNGRVHGNSAIIPLR